MEITLLPESLCLIYWLFPGERYAVRDLGKDGVRIFKMVYGDASAVSLAPHVPTPDFVIERVLELTGVFSESVVYDLGCGDGCVLIRAAEKYRARGVGVDIDSNLIRQARKAATAAGVSSRVRFLIQDIFDTDLSDATLVYLYLYPDSLNLLRPYLEENLKKGTMVACFSFALPGWEEKLVAQHKIEGDFVVPK
ncbi:MAG: methyltransferase domain-containing protein, partial [Candidatus Aminicenantes bacterium]|nr:methyltransferase domain-containing protein [Candidatus Aminicenantes bacterium]